MFVFFFYGILLGRNQDQTSNVFGYSRIIYQIQFSQQSPSVSNLPSLRLTSSPSHRLKCLIHGGYVGKEKYYLDPSAGVSRDRVKTAAPFYLVRIHAVVVCCLFWCMGVERERGLRLTPHSSVAGGVGSVAPMTCR